MAHRGGFEPPTPRFVVWCSIQLSYRCFQGEDLAAGHMALKGDCLASFGVVVCPGQGAYLLRPRGECKRLFELFFKELSHNSESG